MTMTSSPSGASRIANATARLPKPMTKYFVYCRKSSEAEDRQILSIESQEKELSSCAQREGLTISKVFKEEKSAHKRGRPIFAKLMREIERTKAAGLLVWQPNRLARNAYDGGWLITAMDEGSLKEIRTPFRTYANSPDDKFFLQLEFGMAKKDSDDKSINVKRGLRQKVHEGWRPGIAPVGYLNDKSKERGERDIQIDPERFTLVRKIFELYLARGHSVSQICDIAANEWGLRTRETRRMGGKPLSISHIYRILTDPFYYGEFYWGGELVKGKQRPLITIAEYDKVQELLGRKGKPRAKHRLFAFTGLIRCGECGSMITAEEKRQGICCECKLKFSTLNRDDCPRCGTRIEQMANPVLLHYVYYRCSKKKNRHCQQRYVKREALEEQVDAALARVELMPGFKDWALDKLRDHFQSDKEVQSSVGASLSKALEDVQAKLKNLLTLKLSPLNTNGSLLSDEEYAQQKSALVKEKHALEEKQRDQGQSFEDWMALCERAFEFAAEARCLFARGDWETKRSILSALGSNLTLMDQKVLINQPNPFLEGIEATIKDIPEASPNFEPLEPRKDIDFTERIARFDAQISYLLRGWNDVRTYWLKSPDSDLFRLPQLSPEENELRMAA